MKKAEKELVDKISKYTKIDFKVSEYIYERYDASSDTHLLEVKDRGDIAYNDLIIEFDKFAYNRTYGLLTNRKFWYANKINGLVYVWDINDLISRKYEFNWAWSKLPSNTEFANGDLIDKYAGLVHKDDAKHVFTFDSLRNIIYKKP
tara:strand:+ start:2901 stop:3341 length:441 start_codon:yes stop_codon:yes gene_type:complete